MNTCTRRLTFESMHKVLGSKKCGKCHGHSYKAVITVKAKELDNLGMVIDFSAVKLYVGNWVDTFWDHRSILNKDDPILPVLQEMGEQPYIMNYGNPTAENMAKELYEVSQKLLPSNIEVVKVRIWETENCYADYSE